MFSDCEDPFKFFHYDPTFPSLGLFEFEMHYWSDRTGILATLASLGHRTLTQLRVKLVVIADKHWEPHGDFGRVFIDLCLDDDEFDDAGEFIFQSQQSLFQSYARFQNVLNFSPFAMLPWEGPTRGIRSRSGTVHYDDVHLLHFW